MFKKIFATVTLCVSLFCTQPLYATENNDNGLKEGYVYLGGQTVGIAIYTDGLFVSDTVYIENEKGVMASPWKDAGIKQGDYVTYANNIKLDDVSNLDAVVKNSGGKKITLKVRRGEDEFETAIQPIKGKKGGYLLGIWLRDSAAGIGTVSFTTATNEFYALGHGISDDTSGNILNLKSGRLIKCSITGIAKGQRGHAGELKGSFGVNAQQLAMITANTERGLKGTLKAPLTDKTVPIGSKESVCVGEAQIYSDFEDGTLKAYTINIISVEPAVKEKSIMFKVTDQALINKTGGIVQGLSGSPICQNGKLIGAVTHVMINDPTCGYGIFTENMLETAQSVAHNQQLKEASEIKKHPDRDAFLCY